MCSVSNAMIEGRCYPRPSGSRPSDTATEAWQAFRAGDTNRKQAQSTVGDWFQTFGDQDRESLPVFEHYLPSPITGTILVILTVPEEEMFPDIED